MPPGNALRAAILACACACALGALPALAEDTSPGGSAPQPQPNLNERMATGLLEGVRDERRPGDALLEGYSRDSLAERQPLVRQMLLQVPPPNGMSADAWRSFLQGQGASLTPQQRTDLLISVLNRSPDLTAFGLGGPQQQQPASAPVSGAPPGTQASAVTPGDARGGGAGSAAAGSARGPGGGRPDAAPAEPARAHEIRRADLADAERSARAAGGAKADPDKAFERAADRRGEDGLLLAGAGPLGALKSAGTGGPPDMSVRPAPSWLSVESDLSRMFKSLLPAPSGEADVPKAAPPSGAFAKSPPAAAWNAVQGLLPVPIAFGAAATAPQKELARQRASAEGSLLRLGAAALGSGAGRAPSLEKMNALLDAKIAQTLGKTPPAGAEDRISALEKASPELAAYYRERLSYQLGMRRALEAGLLPEGTRLAPWQLGLGAAAAGPKAEAVSLRAFQHQGESLRGLYVENEDGSFRFEGLLRRTPEGMQRLTVSGKAGERAQERTLTEWDEEGKARRVTTTALLGGKKTLERVELPGPPPEPAAPAPPRPSSPLGEALARAAAELAKPPADTVTVIATRFDDEERPILETRRTYAESSGAGTVLEVRRDPAAGTEQRILYAERGGRLEAELVERYKDGRLERKDTFGPTRESRTFDPSGKLLRAETLDVASGRREIEDRALGWRLVVEGDGRAKLWPLSRDAAAGGKAWRVQEGAFRDGRFEVKRIAYTDDTFTDFLGPDLRRMGRWERGGREVTLGYEILAGELTRLEGKERNQYAWKLAENVAAALGKEGADHAGPLHNFLWDLPRLGAWIAEAEPDKKGLALESLRFDERGRFLLVYGRPDGAKELVQAEFGPRTFTTDAEGRPRPSFLVSRPVTVDEKLQPSDVKERLGRVWLGYLTGDRLNEWRGRTSEDKNLIVSNEKVLEVGVQHYAWRGSSDSGGWRYEKETELLKHREDIAGTSVGGRIGGAIDSIPVLGWALDKSAKTGQTLYYGSKGGAQAGSAMISGDDVAALHALGTIYRSPGFRWLAGEERFLKKLEASGDALDVVKGKAQEQRLAALRSEGLSAGTVLPGAWRAYVGAELSDKELVEALAGYGDTAAQLREAAQSPGGSALWNATLRGLSIGAQAGDMGGTMLFDPATLALGGLGARVAAMKGEIGALKEAVALGKVPAWKAAPALDSALRTQRALSGVSLGASGLFAVPMAGGLADDLAGLVNARDLDEALQRGTGAAFNGLLAGHMLTGAVAKRAGAEPADSRASRGGSDWLAGKAIDPESPAAAAKVAEMRAQLLDVVQNNPKLRASLERYLEAALPKEKVGDTMARLEKAIRELDVRFADPADVGDAIARYRSPVDPSASGPRVILLNADLAVASAPTPELLPTLLHELGHHLGLGEPGAHRLQVYLDRALNPEPRSGKLSAPAESDARAREAVGSGRLISELKKEYVADLYADRDADTALAVAKDSLRQQVRIRAAAEEMRGLMERGEWNAVPDKPAWLAERLRTSDRALNVPEDLKAYNDLLQQALRKGGAKNAVPTLLADLDASIARQERLVDGLRRQLGIGVPGEPAPQPPAPPQGGWLKKLTGFFDGGGEQDRAARFASEPQPEAVAQILGELRSPRFQGEGRSAIGVFVDSSGRVAAMGDVVPDGIAKNPAYLSVTLSLGALDRIDLQASPGVASLPRAARRNLEAAVERYNRELGQGR